MKWSKFNVLFESNNNGWFLYNTASGTFVQIDDDTVNIVKQVKETPDMDYSSAPNLYFTLRNGGFLVDDGKDDDSVRMLKMKRTASNYDSSILSLIITLTMECNFACSYCYEKNRLKSKMTDKAEEKIIDFIEKHKSVTTVGVAWYGGEPLLEFERMKSISKKIEALGKRYSAVIITNGYNLTHEVIAAMTELKILSVQITIDGLFEEHDKSRCLHGGEPTFDVIISNIDSLMSSDWAGYVDLRLNTDAKNYKNYADVNKFFKNRYPDKYGKHIKIYPGFFINYQKNNIGTHLNSSVKGRFIVNLARNYDIIALPIFPQIEIEGCVMTQINSYVVGTDGELYKCWEDVGIKENAIGDISTMVSWNNSLVAEGMVGASYLNNNTCDNCFLFPVCNGGCPKIRMHNLRDNGKRDCCSYFKCHLQELLEIYYEQKVAQLECAISMEVT